MPAANVAIIGVDGIGVIEVMQSTEFSTFAIRVTSFSACEANARFVLDHGCEVSQYRVRNNTGIVLHEYPPRTHTRTTDSQLAVSELSFLRRLMRQHHAAL
jgi:hypothetical protein